MSIVRFSDVPGLVAYINPTDQPPTVDGANNNNITAFPPGYTGVGGDVPFVQIRTPPADTRSLLMTGWPK